jgi:hypothetical protein
VDLQKGERYANMDFSLFSTLRDVTTDVLHSYDINCQYSRNLWTRAATLPEDIRPNRSNLRLLHKIPKLHLMGHIISCQQDFSLNNTWGAGRFCGEVIERMWSLINGIAASTREMGPGNHAGALDEAMNYHNWLKHGNIGTFPFIVLLDIYIYSCLLFGSGRTCSTCS